MNIGGRVVSLAGRTLCIEPTSALAQAAIAPALAHLATGPGVDGKQTRWTIVEEDDLWRPCEFAGAGAYRIRTGGVAVVQNDPASFELYGPEVGIELRATPVALAAGDLRAHPACHALAAWLAGPSTQVLHAAAVAYEGAAALIVGAGGVGKSTTVLACARAGAGFLGDDLVLVESGDGNDDIKPTVHCLFATAKLNADSARALGAEAWPSLGVTPKNKAVVAVQDRLQVVRSAPIVALIVLAPAVFGRPYPAPLRMGKVLTSFAPTALPLAWRASTPAAWLATVAALARRLPAYRLPVSWKLDALGTAVREIVSQAAADQTKRRGAR
jgi:hypothetical protein